MKENFLSSLLSAERGSLSSKRLCGLLGWLVCSAVLIMCTVWDRQAPEMVNVFIYSSTVLLGVDSITDIWKSRSASENEK
ncbi:MAG: hypothetical protein MJY72_05000 [Bacteroidales bacterium]|nr:hypothetical protein [Bacteroidales bacterium]